MQMIFSRMKKSAAAALIQYRTPFMNVMALSVYTEEWVIEIFSLKNILQRMIAIL